LEKQVNELQSTIDDLNTCFLSLTDILTDSERVTEDKNVVDGLRKAIQTFLVLARSSYTQNESHEKHTIDQVHKKSPMVTALEQAPHVSLYPTRSAGDRTARKYSTASEMNFRRPLPQSTKALENMTSPSSIGSYKDTTPVAQSIPSMFHATQIDPLIFQSVAWKEYEANDHRFASRLHRAAFGTGYHIVRNYEQNFVEFQQVFRSILQSHTRSDLVKFFANVLMGNFGRLLEPPEMRSSTIGRLDERQSDGSWLNATEVSQYFRGQGFDFDESPLYAELEIDVEFPDPSSTNDCPVAFDFPVPATSSQNFGIFTPLDDFQTINEFAFTAPQAPYVHAKQKVAIDVTKLIRGVLAFI
jgi:hypothetical protein